MFSCVLGVYEMTWNVPEKHLSLSLHIAGCRQYQKLDINKYRSFIFGDLVE